MSQFITFTELTEHEVEVVGIVVDMTRAAADAAPTEYRLRFQGRAKVVGAIVNCIEGLTPLERRRLHAYFTVTHA